MEIEQSHEVTLLLDRIRDGDREAENRLYEIVMPHLRRLAQSFMNRERPDHSLQATELVDEVYLRLAGAKLSLRNRAHFFAIAARAMRRELIDYARKRPKVRFLPLDGLPEKALSSSSGLELALLIDGLLDQMRETMPLECAIVEAKFFLDLTDDATAEMLCIPVRTMQLRWREARIWLFERAEAVQWKPPKP